MNEKEKWNGWIEKFDQTESEIKKTFGHLDESQLNWKMNPEKWSIGQCIDHMIVTNRQYFPVFEALLKDGYHPTAWQKWSPFSGILGKLLHGTVKPENKRPNKTFPVFEPAQSDIPDNILDLLSENHLLLKGYLSKLDRFDFQKTIISSPANKNITYNLEATFNVLTDHEIRHLNQAKEVLSHLPQKV